MSQHCVITGVGAVSPFGAGQDLFLGGLEQGRTCVEWWPEARVCGAKVPEFEWPDHVTEKGLRRASQHVRYGVVATAEALADSGSSADPERRGVVFASAMGSCEYSVRLWEGLLSLGARGASPSLFSEGVPNAVVGHVTRVFGIQGPGHMLGGGSDVGLRALQIACDGLVAGRADVMVVGAAEEQAAIVQRALRHLRMARTREGGGGLALSEGAAALVIERDVDVLRDGREGLATVLAMASTQLTGKDRERSTGRLVALLEEVERARPRTGRSLWVGAAANGLRLHDIEANALAEWQKRAGGSVLFHALSHRVRDLCGDAFSVTPLLQVLEALPWLREGGCALILSLSPFGMASALLLGPPPVLVEARD